jgi:hypothetical protein
MDTLDVIFWASLTGAVVVHSIVGYGILKGKRLRRP